MENKIYEIITKSLEETIGDKHSYFEFLVPACIAIVYKKGFPINEDTIYNLKEAILDYFYSGIEPENWTLQQHEWWDKMSPDYFEVIDIPNQKEGYYNKDIILKNKLITHKLFLDDERTPMSLYNISQQKNYIYTQSWIIVRNYNEFVEWVEKNGLPEWVSFDHDLADEHYKEGAKSEFQEFGYNKVTEKTGYDCANWLIDYCIKYNLQFPNYLVHSFNTVGKKNIHFIIENFIKNREK